MTHGVPDAAPRHPGTSPWPAFATPARRIDLRLDAPAGKVNPMRDLSAAVCAGNTLFLGSDEGASLERLRRDGDTWRDHRRILLAACLDLASADEADIEGLAIDGDWLWVVGSHARTRPKPAAATGSISAADLCNLKDTRPRCLLARLPLRRDPEAAGVLLPVARDGSRRAGMLKQTAKGNSLAAALAADPLLAPFTQVAAKEGGVDIEGIAVDGERIALGMRGPVLQGHALLLEIEIAASPSGRLRMAKGVAKRLLDLEGLGIRDLKRVGDDLLILAGPTTNLDGPCALHRWRGWRDQPPTADGMVHLHRPERVLDLPFGRGEEHPEGLAILASDAGRHEVLVVCDSPGPARLSDDGRSLRCDVFELPA